MKQSIALAQIDPVLGDLSKNVALHVDAVSRARNAGASMVVFPELSLTGYGVRDMHWDLAVRTTAPPPELTPLLEASHGIAILAGGIEEGEQFQLLNSAFLFENGTMRSVHRKVYPPTYGMFEELRYFSPGTSVRAFDCVLGRVGVVICEDLWHVSVPYILALDGARTIIALVASPTRVSGADERLPIAVANSENHKALARFLSTYVVFCNRVGFEDGVSFWGGSEVVAPDGEVLSSAGVLTPDFITATIDENEVRRARRFSRHWLDEDPSLLMNELHRIRNSDVR
jgi:predicted amidohydrolase